MKISPRTSTNNLWPAFKPKTSRGITIWFLAETSHLRHRFTFLAESKGEGLQRNTRNTRNTGRQWLVSHPFVIALFVSHRLRGPRLLHACISFFVFLSC